MKNKKLINGITILLGAFFLLTGCLKVMDSKSFMILIYNYGMAPMAPLGPFIAAFEIVIGISMMLLVYPKMSAKIAFYMMLCFTLAFGYGYFINGVEDCGCFGNADVLKTPPLVSFIRNVIVIVLLYFVWKNSEEKVAKVTRWKGIVIVILGMVAFTTSGMTMVQPLLPAKTKTDQMLAETPLSTYVNPSKGADSTRIVFIFKYDCPHCWDATENVKKYKSLGFADKIIGLGVGTKEAKETYLKQFEPNFTSRDISEEEALELTDAFPTVYILKNDSVKYVMKQDIHSVFTFRRNEGIK